MDAEEDYRQLSELQHFTFCRRQWALIHIENQWEENVLTAKGRIMHDNAHDDTFTELRGQKLIVRGMHVRSERLQVTGICDVVEFLQNEEGITLHGRSGKWMPNPVEYKRGRSKANDCDRMQLCGQVLCLEEMLCCHIESGDLFYGETHRREHVPISDELRSSTEKALIEMNQLYRRHYTPKVRKRKSCKMCSLHDVCLPELEYRSVKEYLDEKLWHLG